MTLTTERLLLRPFTPGDFEACHSYGSDPENVWYMVWGPNTEDETRAFITDCIEQAAKEPRVQYDFAVERREDGRMIGGCGVYLHGEREAMLGWILHKDFWRMGYGTELAAELLRFGFEDLGLHRIYATCNAENYGSYRVMERNGMRREGYFQKCRWERVGDEKKWCDELHYAMLDEEWSARRAEAAR